MRRLLVTAIALALASPVFAQTPAAAPAPSPQAQVTTQLPRNVRPSHYAIEITPHADQRRFDTSRCWSRPPASCCRRWG